MHEVFAAPKLWVEPEKLEWWVAKRQAIIILSWYLKEAMNDTFVPRSPSECVYLGSYTS